MTRELRLLLLFHPAHILTCYPRYLLNMAYTDALLDFDHLFAQSVTSCTAAFGLAYSLSFCLACQFLLSDTGLTCLLGCVLTFRFAYMLTYHSTGNLTDKLAMNSVILSGAYSDLNSSSILVTDYYPRCLLTIKHGI